MVSCELSLLHFRNFRNFFYGFFFREFFYGLIGFQILTTLVLDNVYAYILIYIAFLFYGLILNEPSTKYTRIFFEGFLLL